VEDACYDKTMSYSVSFGMATLCFVREKDLKVGVPHDNNTGLWPLPKYNLCSSFLCLDCSPSLYPEETMLSNTSIREVVMEWCCDVVVMVFWMCFVPRQFYRPQARDSEGRGGS